MNKYRVLDAVITADPNNPTMGILHKVETPCKNAETAAALYRMSLTQAVAKDPFPVAFRIRMQEYRADERWHDIHSASY